jgi:hypothetical protein
MRFNRQNDEIVNLLDHEDYAKAQVKIITESSAFKEHQRKHDNASLQTSEEKQTEEQFKLEGNTREKEQSSGMFGNQDIYQKEAQHVTASCTCGMKFEIIEDNVYSRNDVKAGSSGTYGNKPNSNTNSTSYGSSSSTITYK